MVRQSNCFVVVERGRAMQNMMQEGSLTDSGEMRECSRSKKGQMVAADYALSPNIAFSQKGTSDAGVPMGTTGRGFPSGGIREVREGGWKRSLSTSGRAS